MIFPLHKRPGGRKDVPRQRTWYVGKHGDDGATALDPNRPVLSFNQAITLINNDANAPTITNPCVIICVDDGIYTESMAVPTYTTIMAPGAEINGNHTLQDYSSIYCKKVSISSGTAFTKSAGSNEAWIDVESLILASNANGTLCSSGTLEISADHISVVNGTALGGASTSDIRAWFKYLGITGTGVGIGGTGSGLDIDVVGDFLEDSSGSGTGVYAASGVSVNALISRVSCSGAATNSAASGTINLFTGAYSGTETATGTSNINIADRVVINENETSADNQIVRFDSTTGRKVQAADVTINDSGDILWDTDGTGDIGASGASRPADIFASNDINAGADITAVGTVTAQDVRLSAATGSDILWNTDGGGNVGGGMFNRPDYVYAKTELHSSGDVVASDDVIASGDSFAKNAVQMGDVPAGVANDYGLSTLVNTDTLGLWGIRADGANNVSVQVVADINNATINADHKAFSIGWNNNADSFTELFNFKDGQLEISSSSTAQVLGTEADGGSAVGAQIGSDNAFTTAGARVVEFVNSTTTRGYMDKDGGLGLGVLDNAQQVGIFSLTELTTIAAAASTSTTIQIPAGALVVAVPVYVVTVIPTAATFDVGVVGATTRYGTGLNAAATTDNPGTDNGFTNCYYAAATSIVITPDVQPAAATGEVRVTIYYIQVTPPTS